MSSVSLSASNETLITSSKLSLASEVQGEPSTSLSSVVNAEEPASSNNLSLKSDASYTPATSWPVVILAFLGVVAFIFVLAWAAKRFGGLSAMGVKEMKVVAAMPVGTRERVAIIDVKGQQILIGITSHSINHLHTFDQPVIDSANRNSSEFAQKLVQIMGAKPAGKKMVLETDGVDKDHV